MFALFVFRLTPSLISKVHMTWSPSFVSRVHMTDLKFYEKNILKKKGRL